MIGDNEGNGCADPDTGYPSDCEITQGLREKAMSRQAAASNSYSWKANLERAAKIRLLLLDVDGVLTDGTIIYLPGGFETKGFSTRDGLGIRLAQKAGVEVGIITARQSEVVQYRADNLGIKLLFQGAGKKAEVLKEILAEKAMKAEEVAYMGDDWLDLPAMSEVGLAAAVADAAPEVREIAHFVSAYPGGRGAVRELCELIVEARGRREHLLTEYMK